MEITGKRLDSSRIIVTFFILFCAPIRRFVPIDDKMRNIFYVGNLTNNIWNGLFVKDFLLVQ